MYKEAVKTAIRMIFSPQIAWEYVSMRRDANLYKGFLIPLWAIICLSAFIGGCFVSAESGIELGFKNFIVEVFVLFIGFYISSFLLNEYVATLTGVEKGLKNARVFAAYSSSLLYLVGIIASVLPDFFFLWLFAVYTAYMVYVGAGIYYLIIPEKQVNFMAVTTTVIIGVPLALRLFLSMMLS
jgi:hypothetical protein